MNNIQSPEKDGAVLCISSWRCCQYMLGRPVEGEKLQKKIRCGAAEIPKRIGTRRRSSVWRRRQRLWDPWKKLCY